MYGSLMNTLRGMFINHTRGSSRFKRFTSRTAKRARLQRAVIEGARVELYIWRRRTSSPPHSARAPRIGRAHGGFGSWLAETLFPARGAQGVSICQPTPISSWFEASLLPVRCRLAAAPACGALLHRC